MDLDDGVAAKVAAVRRFSRIYTRRIGVLQDGLLGTDLSLAEGRLLFELAQRPDTAAKSLAADLGLDAGYLSRLLRGFERRGLIERRPDPADGRQSLLILTAAGRDLYTVIDDRSRAEVAALLHQLPPDGQNRLVQALDQAGALLGDHRPGPTHVLRPHRPGDMGWIIHRQALLYAGEYGWDERFEGLVASICAQFIENFDHRRERCWVAERNGAIVGSIFLVRDRDEVAKLRLLYVEPAARGLGLGRHLVAECLAFATAAGYRRISLWTNSVLHSARRIYEQAGFRLVREEPHQSFGKALVGQYWERAL
ncbi:MULTISPECIES: bifunctional helix-turn-helix transcriptional regulator/GNAT family N-acetyltransferase [Nitrospirillum]|uniref:MarR family transcriptional regulator with acetyltransferase activity n=1 Tax=Nitrospirillum amazonense TaxID=28077 RepID=A0A560FHF6_9PROT|nr:helix-turn-helix domain-containing GNAT family N-acetyltransferase [Nitrospirillum amazonense]MEC4590483.1 helix-turn-helix domain-containing GNAT family N-acetyltransferase [Nitrospirillum amazonense]TWB21037.1 MarR family transcriptional regulator with acetyltransferase activity [Nitrospirillum amazonense]